MDKQITAAQPTKPENATFLLSRVAREVRAMHSRFAVQQIPDAAELQEAVESLSKAATEVQEATVRLWEARTWLEIGSDQLMAIQESRLHAGAPEGLGADWIVADVLDAQGSIEVAMTSLVADAWPQGETDEDLGGEAPAPATPDGAASLVEGK